jgi:hypothetical protein
MSLLRRQRSPLARLALFAFLCGAMLPFYEAHPLGTDDAACRLPATEAFAPSVADPGSEPASDHCVVCHLQRGLSGASPSNVAALGTPFASASCQRFDQPAPLSASDAAPSTRGPPILAI